MKRTILAVGLILILIVTACGPTAEPAATTAPAAEPTAAAPEPTVEAPTVEPTAEVVATAEPTAEEAAPARPGWPDGRGRDRQRLHAAQLC